jgi:uncharacterized membrane protein
VAILFYLLFSVEVFVFVDLPELKSGSRRETGYHAALLSLITYAICYLTDIATIKDWSVMIYMEEMAWGTTLTVIHSV